MCYEQTVVIYVNYVHRAILCPWGKCKLEHFVVCLFLNTYTFHIKAQDRHPVYFPIAHHLLFLVNISVFNISLLLWQGKNPWWVKSSEFGVFYSSAVRHLSACKRVYNTRPKAIIVIWQSSFIFSHFLSLFSSFTLVFVIFLNPAWLKHSLLIFLIWRKKNIFINCVVYCTCISLQM